MSRKLADDKRLFAETRRPGHRAEVFAYATIVGGLPVALDATTAGYHLHMWLTPGKTPADLRAALDFCKERYTFSSWSWDFAPGAEAAAIGGYWGVIVERDSWLLTYGSMYAAETGAAMHEGRAAIPGRGAAMVGRFLSTRAAAEACAAWLEAKFRGSSFQVVEVTDFVPKAER